MHTKEITSNMTTNNTKTLIFILLFIINTAKRTHVIPTKAFINKTHFGYINKNVRLVKLYKYNKKMDLRIYNELKEITIAPIMKCTFFSFIYYQLDVALL